MNTIDKRTEMIAAIRNLADLLESHPDLPTPASIHATGYPQSNAGLFDSADLLGVPVMQSDGEYPHIAAIRNLGANVTYKVYRSIETTRPRPDKPFEVTREQVLGPVADETAGAGRDGQL
jgi:hypothetical protein